MSFLYLAFNRYVYWTDNAAQDDNSWHHHVVYIESDDMTNCKWYVDGVLQAQNSAVATGPANAYAGGLRIGRGAAYEFNGNLDEFAVFDGELTPSQIIQIYNAGKPADLSEFSPEGWWRMGDDDDAGGTTIRDLAPVTGDELVLNGNFSDSSVPNTWNGSTAVNFVGWSHGASNSTAEANCAITDGKCRFVSDGTNLVLNSGTTVVGRTYRYSIDVTDVTTGGLTLIGGGVVLEANITVPGTYTGLYTAASTTAISINRQSGITDFTFDNVSVKHVNGNPGTLVNTPTFSTDTP